MLLKLFKGGNYLRKYVIVINSILLRGHSQTMLTFTMVLTLTKSGLFWNTYLLTSSCNLVCEPPLKVNSVQEARAKCFAVHVLKFEILQITWKEWNKEHQTLSFWFLFINLAFWCFLFCFFMRFARFQILICEPQSIWCKLLVQSWL